MSPNYFAKILLFGEYGIIKDAMGLSIPYRSYSGALKLPEAALNESQRLSNQALIPFVEYLQELSYDGELKVNLDLRRLQRDLTEGLYFSIYNTDLP